MHKHPANDTYTVAAIALLAMCVVTFSHEALGHGGTCLALGGHILELSSSIFRCDLHSPWIDPAGPLANLLAGTLALLVATFNRPSGRALRLGLILVASFSFFWEAGYVIKAMAARDGDLYFAGQSFLGEPSGWWRIGGAGLGLVMYTLTGHWLARSLYRLWPDATVVLHVRRTAWCAATLGATLAALPHAGAGWQDLRDAFLEFGAASFPFLLSRRIAIASASEAQRALIPRSRAIIAVALMVFAVFAATLGRGLLIPPA
jgi:hypothetical protein